MCVAGGAVSSFGAQVLISHKPLAHGNAARVVTCSAGLTVVQTISEWFFMWLLTVVCPTYVLTDCLMIVGNPSD
jgi:hypothetical protein